jgi:hypothetical protein
MCILGGHKYKRKELMKIPGIRYFLKTFLRWKQEILDQLFYVSGTSIF